MRERHTPLAISAWPIQLARGQAPKSDLFGPIMMVGRVRVVEGRGHVRRHVAPVLPPIVVNGTERVQRRQRAVYEAGQRMEFGRLSGDEVALQIGSNLMHAPPTVRGAIGAPSSAGGKVSRWVDLRLHREELAVARYKFRFVELGEAMSDPTLLSLKWYSVARKSFTANLVDLRHDSANSHIDDQENSLG